MKQLGAVIDEFQTSYYWCGGNKTPLVFIHGAGVDSSLLSWKEVAQELAFSTDHALCLVDLPGYGATEYKEGVVYSQAFYIGFMESFLKKLGIRQAILIGISLGAGIAIGLALRNSAIVQKLVLIAPNGLVEKWPYHRFSYHCFVNTPLNPGAYKLMAKSRSFTKWVIQTGLFYEKANITNRVLDEVHAAVKRDHAGQAFQSYQKSEYLGKTGVKTCYLPDLPKIDQPVLLFHGKQDRSVPLAAVLRAHRLLPCSTLVVAEKARHWPQKEYPQLFCREVMQFLAL